MKQHGPKMQGSMIHTLKCSTGHSPRTSAQAHVEELELELEEITSMPLCSVAQIHSLYLVVIAGYRMFLAAEKRLLVSVPITIYYY